MIIFSQHDCYFAYFDTASKESGVLSKDIGDFISSHKDIYIGWYCEDMRRRYKSAIFFDCNPDTPFIQYCAEKGLNCVSSEPRNRVTYEVLYMVEHFDEVIAPRFNIYMTVYKKYKLSPMIFNMNDTALLKEVLAWK